VVLLFAVDLIDFFFLPDIHRQAFSQSGKGEQIPLVISFETSDHDRHFVPFSSHHYEYFSSPILWSQK
jgi:hypothetical protein